MDKANTTTFINKHDQTDYIAPTATSKRIRSTREQLARMEKELSRQVGKGANTITKLINQTGWSRQAINRRLAMMVARGELRMVYKGRGTYYERPEDLVEAKLA